MSQSLDAMNLVELLDQLRPMTPPPPISMVPQTTTWLVILLAFLALVIWGLAAIIQHRRRNAYRRAALAKLTQLPDDPAQLAKLLRRTALTAYPRSTVAALQGDDWLDFLDHSYGGKGFQTDKGRVLVAAPYQPAASLPLGLKPLVELWIRRHRRQPC